jgi:AP-2 complex subunit alpha
VQITSLLERRDANVRYVALETLAAVTDAPDVAAALRPHLPLISACLEDTDPSVKRRAVDVLISVCDAQSVVQIVAQLLEHLSHADVETRGDLVVKIAVLAERFPPSRAWYVDTLLALMDKGGSDVGDDVWHRAVHLLSNSEEMRARGTLALVAHLEGSTYSVPLLSTAGCAAFLLAICLPASNKACRHQFPCVRAL